MRREKEIAGNSEVSEKAIEGYLREAVEKSGGLALKFSSGTQTGYPDRVCLFPRGVTVWVEVKGRNGRPTKLQERRIRQLRRLGHMATVVQSREAVERLVKLAGVPVLARAAYCEGITSPEGSATEHLSAGGRPKAQRTKEV